MELFLLLFIGFISYLVSLSLNPWVKCSKSQGKPKQQG
jgi:hypothetical protein